MLATKATSLLVTVAAVAMGAVLLQAPIQTAGAAPTPRCYGEPATIFIPGTKNSATTVQGTDHDEVIVTGPGRDTVLGEGGEDLICTRGGRDAIRGHKGDDRMRGGGGKDVTVGKRGLDRADGGKGGRDVCDAERERRCEANPA